MTEARKHGVLNYETCSTPVGAKVNSWESTTDYSDFTDCCKSLRSCEAAEPNALSTIIQQPSTFYSHADLTNLTKDALLRAHQPPGWLLFQPQMTRKHGVLNYKLWVMRTAQVLNENDDENEKHGVLNYKFWIMNSEPSTIYNYSHTENTEDTENACCTRGYLQSD